MPGRTAIYAGTFDPVTNGHLDILHRACLIFDHVVMAVAENREKRPLFSHEERMQLIRDNLRPAGNVEVIGFDGLLVNLAEERGAVALVRGLRAVSDFEYEFQMAHMNRHLNGEIETIFLMPTEDHFYTSSSIIKQVARYGGKIEALVPENVRAALWKKLGVEGPAR